ncbi:hypothetical protein SARC_05627 [Sphaeroforma arctica JP610]|uniref:SEC7 domain-containing protein n=1 Tax=Sphaeroforma arctica JP610 TaxID=667725 RepID=A0A0L0FZU8_9EUKA|nr:hypothetical protein SARC_05627 [Sphaeroforma arctica JP610]KNC82076.1 hypothetical protein SARC_05627 [Sphaeroforma arctica JP610]|eukprot:XP_014155978.1 hypothetical protein SARC_05627 [Sphaeroforma arctica JP610]
MSQFDLENVNTNPERVADTTMNSLALSKNNFLSFTELDNMTDSYGEIVDCGQNADEGCYRDSADMRQGVYKFSKKAKNGLKLLVDKKIIQHEPESIAALFAQAKKLRISKTMIGEYLGEPDTFNLSVLSALADLINFHNQTFVTALRLYLSYFKLPGEAQKIDRMMQVFADRYYSLNAHRHGTDEMPINSSSATYVLAYSTIMLNTDAHNPNVKRRMTVDDFIKNNRGINDTEDIPQPFLRQIYDELQTTQLMTDDEYMNEMKAEFADSGSDFEPIINNACRYLVQAVDCQQYSDANKAQSNKSEGHLRRLSLFNDMLVVTKKVKIEHSYRDAIALHDATVLSFGSERATGFQLMDAFKRLHGPFICEDAYTTNRFVSSLRSLIAEASVLDEAKGVCAPLRTLHSDSMGTTLPRMSDDKIASSNLLLHTTPARLPLGDTSPSTSPRRRRTTSVSKGMSTVRRALSISSPQTKRSSKTYKTPPIQSELPLVSISSAEGEK